MHFFCKLTLTSTQITLYYVSERHLLNSSIYNSGSWSLGTLSLANFDTAVNTRSLCVAQTSSNETSTGTLLYYENPIGKVSALTENLFLNTPNLDDWVDITSQESTALPESYRNTPGSTAGCCSKTLNESLDSSLFTLSAPFTCGANLSNPLAIEAMFYSTNATGPEIQSNTYTVGPIAGSFSQRMYFVVLYSLANRLVDSQGSFPRME